MAKSRPSYPQIRARQRNILEYQFYTKKSNKDVAKHFGVSPRQLDSFLSTKPKDVRRNYSRSNVAQKLYYAGDDKGLHTASVKGAHDMGLRYTRLGAREVTPAQIQVVKTPGMNTEYQASSVIMRERIQFLYTSYTTPSQCWAQYVSRNNIPRSIKALKLLARNRRLDYDEFETHVSVWRNCYYGDSMQGEINANNVLAGI